MIAAPIEIHQQFSYWSAAQPFRLVPHNQNQAEFLLALLENDLKAVLPELFLTWAVLVLLLYAVIVSKQGVETARLASDPIVETERKQRLYDASLEISTQHETVASPRLSSNLSALACLVVVYSAILVINAPIDSAQLFYNTMQLDKLSETFKLITLLAALAAITIQISFHDNSLINQFELLILMLIAVISMLVLVESSNLITLYLAIELQSLSFYCLAAMKRDSQFSTEAGIKYFLLGSLASGILLLGFSLAYGSTGSVMLEEFSILFSTQDSRTSMVESASISVPSSVFAIAILAILIGLLFKITAAPFHMWAPDVYEGAPTGVTAFFAIVAKISIAAVLIRFTTALFVTPTADWQKLLEFCAIASLIVGTIAALAQTRIKRLIAYSSIAHVGFLLIGLSGTSLESVQAIIIYLVIYVIISIVMFSFLMIPLRRAEEKVAFYQAGSHSRVEAVKFINDFNQIGKTNALLAITLAIAMFSIAGIPPLAGFYSKAYLLFSALSAQQPLLATIAVIASVISCFYYLRIVKVMFFLKSNRFLSWSRVEKPIAFSLGITSLMIVVLCISPEAFFLASRLVALDFLQ